MMTTPKMRTAAPLSPEQIRAIVGQHDELMRRRRYIAVRTVVRIVFWSTVIGVGLYFANKYNIIFDDYRDTCEALGQTCPTK